MPISQRRDRAGASWIALRFEGQRIRRRSPIQTPEGAVEFESQVVQELAKKYQESDPALLACSSTYAEFADRWVRDYVAVANRASTLREKTSTLNSRLLPAFGHRPICDISTNLVDAQVANWMREGVGLKRINNILTVLRRSLRCAREWGLIAREPLIRHHRYFPPVPQYLTRDESERLLAAFEPGFWRTFALFLLRTGVRFGEAAALRWEDLELHDERPFVTIRRSVCYGIVSEPKTRAGRRTIALIPELVTALRVLKYHRQDSPWVFATPSGNFHRPNRTSPVLKRACVKAGVPVITWHKLRHSCATQLLHEGVPLIAIKDLLGHANLEVTTIYAHVTPNAMWSYMHVLSSRTPSPKTSAVTAFPLPVPRYV